MMPRCFLPSKVVPQRRLIAEWIDSNDGLTMIARNSTKDANALNWDIAAASDFTWDGAIDTDWNKAGNWDRGTVPAGADAVIIVDAENEPIIPLSTTLGGLTIQEGVILDLSGKTLTVNGGFSNNGTIKLNGNEDISAPTNGDGSMVEYIDQTTGRNVKDWTYHDLKISAGAGVTYTMISSETLGGDLTVSSGTLDISTQTLEVTGTLTINGGTLMATNGELHAKSHLNLASGTFHAPSATDDTSFTVTGNWTKAGGATFDNGTTGRLVLDGTDQTINGSATFNELKKVVETARTLTFQNGTTQIISGALTLNGVSGQILSLRSSTTGQQWSINPQGTRTISFVDVKDSNNLNATNIAASSGINSGNNTKWGFICDTYYWICGAGNWSDSAHWSCSSGGTTSNTVPAASHNVYFNASSGNGSYTSTVDASFDGQVTGLYLSTGFTGTVSLGRSLTVTGAIDNSAGTFDLNGQSLDATNATFSNAGTFQLRGTETITGLTQDTAKGTWKYVGDGQTGNLRIKDFGQTDYYNLVINDPNENKRTFRTIANLTAAGALDVTAGTIDVSTNFSKLIIDGILTINGGTLSADGGDIDANGNLVLSSGTLTAPTAADDTSFTLAGNWTKSGGTFTQSKGRLVLDGTDQSINGSTTFYQLTKAVTSASTLTFQNGVTQTISNALTLSGAAGQLLSLHSSTTGQQWSINPQGTRSISFVDVKDSNNTNATAISHNNTTNSGNNTNWGFDCASTFYWIGGSGNWNDQSHWSCTSGGSATTSLPDATKSVAIDSNSGNPTVTINVTPLTIVNLTVGSGTINAGNNNSLTASAVTLNGGDLIGGSGTRSMTFTSLTLSDANSDFRAPTTISAGYTHTAGTADWLTNASTCTSSSFRGSTTDTFYNLVQPISGSYTDNIQTADITANNNFTISSSGTPSWMMRGKSITVLGDFQSDAYSFDAYAYGMSGTSTLNVGGSLTVNAAYVWGSPIINMTGTSSGKTINCPYASIININGVGGYWTLASALTSIGTINLNAGTLDVSASNYGISTKNWNSNGGIFVPRSGTVTFTTVGSVNSSGTIFNNVVINWYANTTLASDLNLTGQLTLSGNLDVSPNNYTIYAGTWTGSAGILNPRNCTVVINRAVNSNLGALNSSFYNL